MDVVPFLFFSFLLGLCLGSFFNVVVWRLYTMESLGGRSKCPNCRTQLKARDLIPVVSWYLLGGECRTCKKPISIEYPAIELLTGCAFLLITWKQWLNIGSLIIEPYGIVRTLFMIFVACVLILTIASDAKFNLIYDIIVIPSIIVAFVWRFMIGGKLFDMVLGVVVGAVFFGAQYYVSGGKWIGFGDVKLGVFLGIVFGWYAMLFLIALAYILGTIVSLILLARREKTMRSTLPLGVFLGIAGLYILVYGVRPLERLLHL